MDETDNKIRNYGNSSDISELHKVKNAHAPLRLAVEGGVESTALVLDQSSSSSAFNTKEKVYGSEIELSKKNVVEVHEISNQAKKGMDLFLSKVPHYCSRNSFNIIICSYYFT